MKCERCKHDIPEGDLFCKVCGAEVQLVPDYNTVDHLIQQKENQEKQLIEQEKRIQEEEQKERKHKKTAFIALIVGMGIGVLGLLIWFLIVFRLEHSYEYQMKSAIKAYQKGQYGLAMNYTDQALTIRPGDFDAQMMNADIYIQIGYPNEAAHILKSMIYYEPDNIECYGKLIYIYETQQKFQNIKALLDECTSEIVLEEFSEYVCNNPSFVTLEGTYKRKLNVEISLEGEGTIYYTTDGTIPTNESQIYEDGILLEEGKTTVMAVVYNKKGVSSDIIARDFTVVLERPEAPQIVPASGSYQYGSKINVIIPEGCKAYFAFDKPADTAGKLYQEPVTMLRGEHIFNVILIDENGKQSYPASQTYVVE